MSAWPWGRASIQLWPPGTHSTGERANGRELERGAPGRDAVEAAPLVEDRDLLGHEVAHLAALVHAP